MRTCDTWRETSLLLLCCSSLRMREPLKVIRWILSLWAFLMHGRKGEGWSLAHTHLHKTPPKVPPPPPQKKKRGQWLASLQHVESIKSPTQPLTATLTNYLLHLITITHVFLVSYGSLKHRCKVEALAKTPKQSQEPQKQLWRNTNHSCFLHLCCKLNDQEQQYETTTNKMVQKTHSVWFC